ncbi:MAG: TRC40/GET3/ArsA family transport-energizing ATPase [Eubacteriales bacterium]|nr:TRC40/GET3/ArsA family transport-energizing ATPase [Eubacteriales bacterium]
MRILIYTGKGGVGKTSIAAATAVRAAQAGKKVLLMSTDQAHSLGDSLCMRLRSDPREVFPGLEALEIDPTKESRRAWGTLRDYLRQLIDRKANGGIEADEVLLFPGLEELCSLIRILDVYEEGRHDVVVVDCAPTGETLALLRYPERLSVLADRLLPMVRGFTSAFGGLITRRTTVPKPRDMVFAEFDALVKRLNALQKILRNRQITSLRIVTTPERIVLEEARRNFTWMCEYDFGVDAVCINRIYPGEAMQGYFAGWNEIQQENLRIAAESFPGRKHFYLYLQQEEIRGIPSLLRAAEELYGEEDPVTVFCKEETFQMEYDAHTGLRTLLISLPYAEEEEILAEKEGEDLILHVRSEVRRLRLPDLLCRRDLSGWKLEDGILKLQFGYAYQNAAAQK